MTTAMCSVVCACGRRGTWDYKLPVDVIMCVSFAVSYMRVNLPEFPHCFYCLIQISCLLIFRLILGSIFRDKSFSQMRRKICNATAILEVSGKLNLLMYLNRVPLIVLGLQFSFSHWFYRGSVGGSVGGQLTGGQCFVETRLLWHF